MPQSKRIEEIVIKHSPALLSYIRSQVKNHEDAQDILQDVLLRLARADNDSDYQIDRVTSWLYRVARNLVLNFWRKQRELSLSSLFDTEDDICRDIADTLAAPDGDNPETLYFRNLLWEELDDALAQLPPEQREVFCLTTLDGLSIKEIAETTGVAPATLTSRKHYAVAYLRKRFHELYLALTADY